MTHGHVPKIAFKNGKAYCKICGVEMEKQTQDECTHSNNRLMMNNPKYTVCTDCWFWWLTERGKSIE